MSLYSLYQTSAENKNKVSAVRLPVIQSRQLQHSVFTIKTSMSRYPSQSPDLLQETTERRFNSTRNQLMSKINRTQESKSVIQLVKPANLESSNISTPIHQQNSCESAQHDRLFWLKQVMDTEKSYDPVAFKVWNQLKMDNPIVSPLNRQAVQSKFTQFANSKIVPKQSCKQSSQISFEEYWDSFMQSSRLIKRQPSFTLKELNASSKKKTLMYTSVQQVTGTTIEQELPLDKEQLINPIQVKRKRLELHGTLSQAAIQHLEGLLANHQLQNKSKPIEEVVLNCNGLQDQKLSYVIDLMQGCNNLKELSCCNNQIGDKSLTSITTLISKSSNLTDLRLSDLRLSNQLLNQLVGYLSTNTQITKLKLASVNLGQCKNIKQFFTFVEYDNLKVLDLAWTSLNMQTIHDLWLSLATQVTQLQDLNVAYNQINQHSTLLPKIIESMNTFFKNCNRIIHFDLTGCQFGDSLHEVCKSIAAGHSMQAVHLTDNDLSKETVTLIKQYFRIKNEEVTSEKINVKTNQSLETIVDSLKKAKRDNIAQQINMKGGVGRIKHEINQLVFQRVINHIEMSYFTKRSLYKWRIVSGNKCWVCECWKQVVIMYDRKQNTLNMSRDIMGRIFMIKLNEYVGTWDIRRAPPTIQLVQAIDSQKVQQIQMCPLMKFCSRLDPKLQRQFNQINVAIRAQSSTNRDRDSLIAKNQQQAALNDSIQSKLDIDCIKFLKQNLKYYDNSQIVDLPVGSRYFANEMQDDEVWLWSGFLPFGTHKFIIDDPINSVKEYQILVAPRRVDLESNQYEASVKEEDDLQKSIFQNWKQDDLSTYQQCLTYDSKQIDLEDLVKPLLGSNVEQDSDNEDNPYNQIKRVILNYYESIVKIHTVVSSQTVSYPGIDFEQFDILFKYMFEDDEIQSFQIYCQSNYEKPLQRDHFLKALILTAIHKYEEQYNDSDKKPLFHDYLDKWLRKYILPVAAQLRWQEFRDEHIWKESVSSLLKFYYHSVRRMFNHYQKIVNMKSFFGVQSALNLIIDCRLMQVFNCNNEQEGKVRYKFDLTIQKLKICWNMSKMTIKDLSPDRQQHMFFVEFLEFLCRLAWICKVGVMNSQDRLEEISGMILDSLRVDLLKRTRRLTRQHTYTASKWLFTSEDKVLSEAELLFNLKVILMHIDTLMIHNLTSHHQSVQTVKNQQFEQDSDSF